MPILLKNGCLVTLRYCELSVTEFVFVCLFLYFAQLFALFLAYAHALKSSVLHLFFFIILFIASTFYCLLGSHMLLGLSTHSCETCVLNSAAIHIEGGPIPDTSV